MLTAHEEKAFIIKHLSLESLNGLSVGDKVLFINDYCVDFWDCEVIGFAENKLHCSGDSPYWFGRDFKTSFKVPDDVLVIKRIKSRIMQEQTFTRSKDRNVDLLRSDIKKIIDSYNDSL